MVVKMVRNAGSREPMNRSDTTTATCPKCDAEIVVGEHERASVAVCARCGKPVERVSVIEDSTDRGFDPTVYYDR